MGGQAITTGNSKRERRYQFVTAAHELILELVTLREPDFLAALSRFLGKASARKLPVAEADAILLKLLSILNPLVEVVPSLLDRYAFQSTRFPTPLARFCTCMEGALRDGATENRYVASARNLIRARYWDPNLTEASVAKSIGVSAGHLSAVFSRDCKVNFSTCLRNVRLDAAALMLTTSSARIKEIWVAVGYNDASNFDHQFKERFGVTPTESRRRPRCLPARASQAIPEPGCVAAPGARRIGYDNPRIRARVLYVDDNDTARETIGRLLRLDGYEVVLAASGQEALVAAHRLPPDVMVLDYHLPDMDGLALLRAFRRWDHLAETPVLVFTADWEVEDLSDDLQHLRAHVLSKLCDVEAVDCWIAANVQFSSINPVRDQ